MICGGNKIGLSVSKIEMDRNGGTAKRVDQDGRARLWPPDTPTKKNRLLPVNNNGRTMTFKPGTSGNPKGWSAESGNNLSLSLWLK